MATLDYSNLLSNIPDTLRDELVGALHSIQKNYREFRWEPSELNGGKLCEIIYCIIRGHADSAYPKNSSKPPNMVAACNAMASAGADFPRSIRIQIPRMIIALYEIRNNRGVGHVGGEVSPNSMDATCVLSMSKWMVSELIRVFHNCSIADAEKAVEAISSRTLPIVWDASGTLRVLDTSLDFKQQTLVLLYQAVGGVPMSVLMESLEHNNGSNFRRDVLNKLHKKRLINFNSTNNICEISPTGIEKVESQILNTQ